jgi:hypothetical protein
VVNVTYVEQKTQKKVIVEKVAAAGTLDPAGKGALGKVAVFAPPAKGVEKPSKLKKVEELALVSKTKGQAGNEKALDLATLHKLKGPPPGKKATAGPPAPPTPLAGAGKTDNAAKEAPCTNGLARKAPGGQCECLPPKKELNGTCETPAAAAAKEAPCTNGLARKAPGGQCECLPPKKEANGTCEIPPAAAAKPAEAPCTNGLARRAPGGQCECLPPKKEVNGTCEIPPPAGGPPPAGPKTVQCPAGQKPQGNGCVPAQAPCPAGQHRGPDDKCHPGK